MSTPRFEDALDVRALDDGRNWQVLEAFHYDTDVWLTPSIVWNEKDREHTDRHEAYTIGYSNRTSGWRIEIPAGFVTDFASIPRPLWAIVGGPADGRYRKAAVVHDFLYRTVGLCQRGEADAVLLEAMKVCGCGWWERTVIYSGVRAGGGRSWNSYR